MEWITSPLTPGLVLCLAEVCAECPDMNRSVRSGSARFLWYGALIERRRSASSIYPGRTWSVTKSRLPRPIMRSSQPCRKAPCGFRRTCFASHATAFGFTWRRSLLNSSSGTLTAGSLISATEDPIVRSKIVSIAASQHHINFLAVIQPLSTRLACQQQPWTTLGGNLKNWQSKLESCVDDKMKHADCDG